MHEGVGDAIWVVYNLRETWQRLGCGCAVIPEVSRV
jgi:hypothetical protein